MPWGPVLTGLSAAAGDMPQAESQWQEVEARRQALLQAQRQRQAQAAFFSSLLSPDMAVLPQQGPQGLVPGPTGQGAATTLAGQPPTPPVPGQGPSPAAGAGPFSAVAPPPSPPAGGGPSAPPAPAVRPGAGPGAAAYQPPTMADPMARLRQMAQALKRANPGMDDLTLATALEQQVNMMRGLAPDDRAQLQAETQVLRIQSQADLAIQRAQNAQQVAEIRADTARQIADIRDATTRRGQDIRSQTAGEGRVAAMERTRYVQDRIDQRAARAAGNRQQNQQVAARYKSIMAQRAAIKDQISAFNAGTPGAPDQSKIPQLQAQLQQLDNQAVQFWSQNPWLPRPSELDRGDTGQAAEAPAGGTAPPAQPGAAAPSGAGSVTVPMPGAAAAPGATPPKVTTQEQYDALPPGSPYIGPDGQQRVKGGG